MGGSVSKKSETAGVVVHYTPTTALETEGSYGVVRALWALKEEESCVVCMCDLGSEEISQLDKCSHRFHKSCIQATFAAMQPRCPVCGTWYGVPRGNQPEGTMTVGREAASLPGHPRAATITIHYSLQGGVQTTRHPRIATEAPSPSHAWLRPGVPFSGTYRTAYLPDTPEGRVVLSLLQKAWDYKLIFTVGDSVTSGAQNTTVWNNIHHKTSRNGGQHEFGYPDATYLGRVEMELAAQGVTRDLLK